MKFASVHLSSKSLRRLNNYSKTIFINVDSSTRKKLQMKKTLPLKYLKAKESFTDSKVISISAIPGNGHICNHKKHLLRFPSAKSFANNVINNSIVSPCRCILTYVIRPGVHYIETSQHQNIGN